MPYERFIYQWNSLVTDGTTPSFMYVYITPRVIGFVSIFYLTLICYNLRFSQWVLHMDMTASNDRVLRKWIEFFLEMKLIEKYFPYFGCFVKIKPWKTYEDSYEKYDESKIWKPSLENNSGVFGNMSGTSRNFVDCQKSNQKNLHQYY